MDRDWPKMDHDWPKMDHDWPKMDHDWLMSSPIPLSFSLRAVPLAAAAAAAAAAEAACRNFNQHRRGAEAS